MTSSNLPPGANHIPGDDLLEPIFYRLQLNEKDIEILTRFVDWPGPHVERTIWVIKGILKQIEISEGEA